MKILLIDVDSKIPNLALMKISKYYKNLYNEVGFHVNNPNKVYISCIYSKNREQTQGLAKMYPNSEVIIGGPGVNYNHLPLEFENCPPDYDLYPSTYSQGYTTRGCIRNCSWCIVRDKEGDFRRNQHVKMFASPRFDTVMIMDNNWLADPEWFFENTDFILEEKLKVIEHGLDVRLLTPEIAERLAELKFVKTMKFAYDQPAHKEDVINGLNLLKAAGIDVKRKVMFYVLAGYNTTFPEDLERCNQLKKWGTSAFLMQYKRTRQSRELAGWVNRPHHFFKTDFSSFKRHYYDKITAK